MKQIEFIKLANNIKGVKVSQDTEGRVIAIINDTCKIIHEYKRGNRMTIIFTSKDGEDRFIVSSKVELQLIYSEHIEYINDATHDEKIKRYCENNLARTA